MSLRPQPLPPVPDDTVRVAQAAFRRGNPYMLMRDRLGTVFADADFADLYPKLGQRAYAPWRLALVTLMQFREGLSDRQAAEAVRSRIDWKYLLALGLADAGFDSTAPTAWIAEGLLIYLPPAAQDKLLDDVTALSAPGSRIATEQMEMSGLPEDWAEKLTERSRRTGSKIDLAALFYMGDRSSAGQYLTAHGWRAEVLMTADAFSAQGFELPDDELAGFEGNNSGYLTAILEA